MSQLLVINEACKWQKLVPAFRVDTSWLIQLADAASHVGCLHIQNEGLLPKPAGSGT